MKLGAKAVLWQCQTVTEKILNIIYCQKSTIFHSWQKWKTARTKSKSISNSQCTELAKCLTVSHWDKVWI